MVWYVLGMKMRYTIKDFNRQFPDDAACLKYLFDQRFPNGGTCKCGKTDCFYPVTGRKTFACSWCGFQVSPTAGTIFHKSPTSLRTWFHAMFLMTASRNGVSAMELMRQVGVTYKCAWRINHQIRQLMRGEAILLAGIIEADETYVGGKRPGVRGRGAAGKTPVAGLLERGGDVNVTAVPDCKAATLMPNITAKVQPGSTVFTDEFRSYNGLTQAGFHHAAVDHGRKQYVRGIVHTNGMESFWAQFKRSVHGTFHHVSRKHMQKYLNEFSYRSNHRQGEPMFVQLASTAGEQRPPAV
ncbi:MAG: IS1595 family transposase [Verrucomicrobiota bacterium]|jgi:transposase-like protein